MANRVAGALVAATKPPSLWLLAPTAPPPRPSSPGRTAVLSTPKERCPDRGPTLAELRRAGVLSGSSPWG
jgi:hypothetical protein